MSAAVLIVGGLSEALGIQSGEQDRQDQPQHRLAITQERASRRVSGTKGKVRAYIVGRHSGHP